VAKGEQKLGGVVTAGAGRVRSDEAALGAARAPQPGEGGVSLEQEDGLVELGDELGATEAHATLGEGDGLGHGLVLDAQGLADQDEDGELEGVDGLLQTIDADDGGVHGLGEATSVGDGVGGPGVVASRGPTTGAALTGGDQEVEGGELLAELVTPTKPPERLQIVDDQGGRAGDLGEAGEARRQEGLVADGGGGGGGGWGGGGGRGGGRGGGGASGSGDHAGAV